MNLQVLCYSIHSMKHMIRGVAASLALPILLSSCAESNNSPYERVPSHHQKEIEKSYVDLLNTEIYQHLGGGAIQLRVLSEPSLEALNIPDVTGYNFRTKQIIFTPSHSKKVESLTNDPRALLRASVAHEIAHAWQDLTYDRKIKKDKQMELQADCIAGIALAELADYEAIDTHINVMSKIPDSNMHGTGAERIKAMQDGVIDPKRCEVYVTMDLPLQP